MVGNEKIYFLENVIIRKEDFGYMLYKVNDGRTYIINGIGKIITDECKEGTTPTKVVKKISKIYPGIDEQVIKEDVMQFFEKLANKNIIYTRAI